MPSLLLDFEVVATPAGSIQNRLEEPKKRKSQRRVGDDPFDLPATAEDTAAMTAASEYQQEAQSALRRHFADVRLEWSIIKDATDAFAPDLTRYAPRVDIAVGPFNTMHGPDPRIRGELIPPKLRGAFSGRQPNQNPRCLLAIEVIYSGTSKHVMGDMLNASALGLYGVIIGLGARMPQIQRIGSYLEALEQLKKQKQRLFDNVITLSADDFNDLIS